jgi:hypothetical protein
MKRKGKKLNKDDKLHDFVSTYACMLHMYYLSDPVIFPCLKSDTLLPRRPKALTKSKAKPQLTHSKRTNQKMLICQLEDVNLFHSHITLQ